MEMIFSKERKVITMPGFDGTGPRGQGAMTGGVRGYCVAELNDAGARPINGRCLYGRVNGRGHRNCFNATGVPGWVRSQRGMQAFGCFGSFLSREK
jgi:hypothetical protein